MQTQVKHEENESCILQASWPKPRLVLIKNNHYCLIRKNCYSKLKTHALSKSKTRLKGLFKKTSCTIHTFFPELGFTGVGFPEIDFPGLSGFSTYILSLAFIKEKSNRRIFQSFWKVSKKRNVLAMKILIR